MSHSPIRAVLGLLPHGRDMAQGTQGQGPGETLLPAVPPSPQALAGCWELCAHPPSGDVPCQPSRSRSSMGTLGQQGLGPSLVLSAE